MCYRKGISMAQVTEFSVSDVIQFMTQNDLELYKRSGSAASLVQRVEYKNVRTNLKYKKGVVFVSPTKEDLQEGIGYIVTSYETLNQQYNDLSHWTPNTFRYGTYYNFKKRIIKGHTKDNLKQINVIGFDIDTKKVDPYEIFLTCDEVGLPRPNIVLETPKGYQGFFVLETPFFIHAKEDYKALRVAERVSENMLNGLKKSLPIDLNCNPFGFFRMPADSNIIFFDDQPVNTNQLISWSISHEKEERKNKFRVIYGGAANAEALDYTSSDWYKALINAVEIGSGHLGAGRNNALYTLALANYASEKPFEEAYDELDQFNSNLKKPLSKREFEKTIKSAYSGRRAGPKRTYVDGLLQLWTDGSATFSGRNGWYKFKKNREDRVRSHYDERESDLVEYLKAHISATNPYFEGSLKTLAEEVGMALSTLKEVLKRSKLIVKKVIGRGRNAVTKYTTKSILFKHLLVLKQARRDLVQLSAFTSPGHKDKLKDKTALINLDREIEAIEAFEDGDIIPGNSPPTIKYIS
ncbi:primase C-terminal domain-containing protein [Bacillus mesophilum]|uniref:Plasmid replication protein n=1 Tax=Bacillus mesophilum TaxID=1071718 RepID=A0A7V7UT19_9BACI|nr:primase C-terminal domain-containing protein [Bacillus mesophilum]KAB2329473.1 plasmid replication protein [Bacillus mesophilum]